MPKLPAEEELSDDVSALDPADLETDEDVATPVLDDMDQDGPDPDSPEEAADLEIEDVAIPDTEDDEAEAEIRAAREGGE